MTQNPEALNQPSIGVTSKMSFAVAACAFGAAAIGLLVNQWLSGWMAVGGMTGVGLFYLAVGLLNLGARSSAHADESNLVETSAHRLSGVANVDDVAVTRDQEEVGASMKDALANASR